MCKYFPVIVLLLASCGAKSNIEPAKKEQQHKIVSINGSISEVLVEFGLENEIVGVDATSTFPENLKSKTQIGNAHKLNVEQIIALQPTVVLSLKERGLKPENVQQLEQAGISVKLYDLQNSVASSESLIKNLGIEFKKEKKADSLIAALQEDIKNIPAFTESPKVLFIYARGAGAVQAAGDNTAMSEMIKLAGAISATAGQFEGFKSLTPEALLASNPDHILLFNTGFESLNGEKGLLEIPGMNKTNAGKNKRFITMDGQFLSGFGPRTGKAAIELAKALQGSK